jgi:hypothetical protein
MTRFPATIATVPKKAGYVRQAVCANSDAQVAEIAGSIRAFGFTNPILAGEDGDVIAGHGRLCEGSAK